MIRTMSIIWLLFVFPLIGCNVFTGASEFEEGPCAPGCLMDWLDNGVCNEECNVANCDWDDGDCIPPSGDADTDLDDCPVSCPPSWIGDGECDDVCWNAECNWDGDDCGDSCATGCPESYIGDGICDEACLTEACGYDDGDCSEYFICPLSGAVEEPKVFCDGVNDCADDEDEDYQFCELTGYYITCEDYSASLPLNQYCDGANDCTDGSDEAYCELADSCTTDQFPCNDGSCVSVDLAGDEVNDCSDGSDEGTDVRFICYNGSATFPYNAVCDGWMDCTDGSDEWYAFCPSDIASYYTCWDASRSIPLGYLCDNYYDCDSGEDEDTDACALSEELTP